ncbi:PREDICTED: activating signal cointegrator 1 complex subunit 1 isoform X2 [Dinoponera quadriceps]|nr:PREDICTED: activating signal cointegrator 1 complex subunit 1 isoform X2 [Dinoponera quadriceps]XP_014478833.1 PREDICTED: activating signal cointegrator 1 complex subunit 1 isoform X2 [Dinoponera quadriceps]
MEDKEPVCSDEELENEIEIVDYDAFFKHTFYVPKIFYSHIIGAKGTILKKLEVETKATIYVPKKKDQDENIVITAQDRKAIVSAKHRIDLLVEASKKKIRFTHFLSIPLNTEEIIEKYYSFKNNVLENYGKTAYNIDESLFQTSSKLHLTIGVLKLFDDKEKEQAVNALMHCKENIIDPILEKAGPLNIHLRGVACMNDDPTEVKVLFAQVTPNEKLQEIVDKIADYFTNIGLREKEYERVKLHMTVMNIHFKDEKEAYKQKFNASEILKIHENTLFGTNIFNRIDISETHTATKDNYYKSIASITF